MKFISFTTVALVLIFQLNALHCLAASKYQIEKLITDLNDNPQLNTKAQADLIELGREVIPRLLDDVKLYVDPNMQNCMHAGRSLRVLSQLHSSESLPVCREILLRFEPKEDYFRNCSHGIYRGDYGGSSGWENCRYQEQGEQFSMLAEAIQCVYACFSDKQARDIYVEFITKRQSIWLHSYGYETMIQTLPRQMSGVGPLHRIDSQPTSTPLDIFKGLSLLVSSHDDRAEDIALIMLNTLPESAKENQSFFVDFGANGFSPTRHTGKDFTDRVMDSQGRYRIVCMRFLRELHSRKAIPVLEKFLKSSQDYERNYALATLEEITSEGGSQAKTIDAAADKVLLRNNDVLTGKVGNESISIKTSYSTLKFKIAEISYLGFEGGTQKTDSLELRVGDKLSGTIVDEEIKLKLIAGGETVLKKRDVSNITFGK